MAIQNRNPSPGCIHRSDQAIQYTSSDYVNELKRYSFRISMARKGNLYENAACESFVKTLKEGKVISGNTKP